MNRSVPVRSVVTGGASGIGAAIAARFAADGFEVVGIDRQAFTAPGVTSVRADLSTPSGVTTSLAAATALLGAIDILVCAAGISRIGPFAGMADDDLTDQLAVNLLAPMRLCQGVLPSMCERRAGRIIVIVSELAEVAQSQYVGYCATKGGLRAFVRALALEYATSGVRINGISPGPIDTPMLAGEFASLPDPAAEQAAAIASVPIGRLGRPQEIAAVAAFLAGPAPALLHGQVIVVDGGKTLS